MRSRPMLQRFTEKAPESQEKLFTQVMEAAKPQILKLWEEGDRYFPKEGVRCPKEIEHQKNVGRSYYQCQPHFWQCFWEGGIQSSPSLEIDLFGQTFHLVARGAFEPIQSYSENHRFYEMFKRSVPGLGHHYGYLVEFEIQEIPGLTQPMFLADTCRDTYLPERIYGYGKNVEKKGEGFVWDNFDRNIFIDKFYVTNQQVNEWRVLAGDKNKIIPDRKLWPHPALIDLEEQKKYCQFFGKRVLEAKLFDAGTMTPANLKNPLPEKVQRPDTPWQRDITKTFLGMSRINPDYQLTPLDCQLAQVQGCSEKYFSTDSATWMGMYFALGFFPESLVNTIDPLENLKMSSRFLPPASSWHQLGSLSKWDGVQKEKENVAFRCYEEVSP